MAGRGDEKTGFDALMAQMGVRPMKGGRPSGPATADARTPSKKPARLGPQASGPPPVPPASGPTPLDTARAELAAARVALAEREAAAGTLREQLDAAEAVIGDLNERLREVERHRASLHRALGAAQAEVVESEPPADLVEVLRARGLLGSDEMAAALAALAEARQIERLLPLLVAIDRAEFDDLLDDRLALVCSSEACQPPPGRAVVLVPPGRCEVCGGSDLRRLAARFENACLLHGCKRVTIVGGSPRYHRQLRLLFDDVRRVRVTLVPGDRRRTARQARADLEGSDLVLLWGATLLAHDVSALYGGGPARVVAVPHRGLAGMLLQASAALER